MEICNVKGKKLDKYTKMNTDGWETEDMNTCKSQKNYRAIQTFLNFFPDSSHVSSHLSLQ